MNKALPSILLILLLTGCSSLPVEELEARVNDLETENLLLKTRLEASPKTQLAGMMYISEPNTVEGAIFPYRIEFDSDQWKYRVGTGTMPSEYAFRHKEKDLNIVILPERGELDLPYFQKQVLSNAKRVDPEAVILNLRKAEKNGKDIVYMTTQVTVGGEEQIHSGFLYTGPEGSLQVFAYMPKKFWKIYEEEYMRFFDSITLEFEKGRILYEN